MEAALPERWRSDTPDERRHDGGADRAHSRHASPGGGLREAAERVHGRAVHPAVWAPRVRRDHPEESVPEWPARFDAGTEPAVVRSRGDGGRHSDPRRRSTAGYGERALSWLYRADGEPAPSRGNAHRHGDPRRAR